MPTSCFAKVLFANVLCHSSKKLNERCACICFVLSAMIQKNVIRIYLVLSATDQVNAVWELTQHVRETTSEVSEQDVGEKNLHSDKNCRVVFSCGTFYRAVLGGSNICRRENC